MYLLILFRNRYFEDPVALAKLAEKAPKEEEKEEAKKEEEAKEEAKKEEAAKEEL